MQKIKKVIWRSKSNRDLFYIGIRYVYSGAMASLYSHEQFCIMAADVRQLRDLFDKETVEELLKLLPGKSYEIEIYLRVKSAL